MSQTNHDGVGVALLGATLRALYAWRLELFLYWAAWQELRLSTTLAGPHAGPVIGLAGILAVVLIPWTRRPLLAAVRRARWSRRWGRILRRADIVPYTYRLPKVVSLDPVATGERLELLLPPGLAAADLLKHADRLATALQASRVSITAHLGNAARVQVLIVRHDPLAGSRSVPWPNQRQDRLSLWDPIPVGVDENGRAVTISLAERNVLLGGEPGAGKSSALSMLVATAALDPTARLWLLDGKLVELAPWSGCAEGTAGMRTTDAVSVLRTVRDEMEARYAVLLERRRRKVTKDDGLPFHVVVCDELAHYLNSGEKRDRTEFAELLRDLVSRGRAAGIIVLAATQKPASDVVPTSLRDLFGFRWALRCSTPQASDTILGSGWASAGYSATTVDAASRGVGFLLHEGGVPQRLRAFYLDDDSITALAERAEAARCTAR
jgi:hypothetical protein